MFYLHKMILATNRAVIYIDENPEPSTTFTYLNGAPISYFQNDAGKVPNKNLWTLGPVETENEAKNLALALAEFYVCDILKDGKLLGLPFMGESGKWVSKSDAAAALGRLGGKANTTAQNAARAKNAKHAGRPKNSKNKPKDSHA